ncbi:hypothetical protein GCM10010215_13270 [Streptomyces virginiae]|uniref:Uncharacterized protein n=1 Tax=Streptomyces virginiae TaxID=1961 RepID=A0ABQ3NVV7_STRVG|nr:hypothetical protein GCM10010215_13270 [Streptomyces virginiae]GHI16910.1 hypothetical protein Scinn_63730 [Streptomyces virginiae]GLV90152.1 hypothetical protein Slala04_16060 [Streptomyces lavendulae subsp. lavendulae]
MLSLQAGIAACAEVVPMPARLVARAATAVRWARVRCMRFMWVVLPRVERTVRGMVPAESVFDRCRAKRNRAGAGRTSTRAAGREGGTRDADTGRGTDRGQKAGDRKPEAV